MKRSNNLSLYLAGAMAVATLLGPSAFAENRHRDATPRDRQVQIDRSEAGRPTATREAEVESGRELTLSPRVQVERVRGGQVTAVDKPHGAQPDRAQNAYQPRGGQAGESYGSYQPRGGQAAAHPQRGHGYTSSQQGGSHGNWYGRGPETWTGSGNHFVTQQGRISQVRHERGGYRVWLEHGRYSYWVPEARYHAYPLRVGFTVSFGGYWDPLGFVNVYDIGGYPGYAPVYTSRLLHGTVASVNYRFGMMTVVDDVSGRYVEVAMGRDPDLDDVRRGDRVELYGVWTRDGMFRADRVDFINDEGWYRR